MASDLLKTYFSYEHIHKAIEALVPHIVEFGAEVIIAIGGGGFIPARILRTHIKLPILAVTVERYDDATRSASDVVRRLQWLDDASIERARGKRILIVDEVDDSRITLAFCALEIQRICAPTALAVAVVHDKKRAKLAALPAGTLHFAGEVLAGDCWACYPWDAASYGLSLSEHEALANRPRPDVQRTFSGEPLQRRAFRGTFMHAPDRSGGVELLDDALVIVSAGGEIEDVLLCDDSRREAALTHFAATRSLVSLPADVRVLPGFIDLHVHAPQWQQAGRSLDVPLEEWLQVHTFPLEARFSDPAYASGVYPELVAELLANGTTTAVYYASRHPAATRVLAQACLDLGQRALVGKVAMDDPRQCPAYYRDATPDDAVRETREIIDFIRSMPGNGPVMPRDGDANPTVDPSADARPPRVLPVITPRFIPSCTDALLTGLGALAAETGCHVQTHCSESDWEHGFALERFGCTDTEALDRFGLLTRRTILGRKYMRRR